jgi:hypothetical protein
VGQTDTWIQSALDVAKQINTGTRISYVKPILFLKEDWIMSLTLKKQNKNEELDKAYQIRIL